jgi:hypothetical protein
VRSIMGRGKTLVKQSAVERAARGILAAAAAAGITGDLEVNVETGVVKFHVGGDSAAPPTVDKSEDIRKLLWNRLALL